jgi:hypothetical protein
VTRGRIDTRRRLAPRDYLVHPDLFGEDRHADFAIPADGDEPSLAVARVLHDCICLWRHGDRPPTGAAMARRFGFSRQTWSHVVRGYRWPGHTVFSAIVIAARDANAQVSLRR